MDLKEIRTLIDLMKKNGLTVFKMEREGFKITLKSGSQDVTHVIQSAPAGVLTTTVAPASPAPSEASNLAEIKSPMVGTFYSAPNPDSGPFVAVGDRVVQGQTLCIIEAMKIFNEITADRAGTVREIKVQNAEPVEFGQALFILTP